MFHRVRSTLMVGLLVTSLAAGVVTAAPPQPGSDDNGLTDNESATLWSRDADNYSSQEAYRQQYGEQRSAVQQVANGTDITFTRPPATAATWTRNDFRGLTAGDADTAVHPPHADLADSTMIKDAHATIFGVHPSTRGHLGGGEEPVYVAPNGTLRGLVDYRVRVPDDQSVGSTTVEWSLADHSVETVRLKQDGEVIAEQAGTQTPSIAYQIDDAWNATLTLEAEIRVRLKRTVKPGPTSDRTIGISYETDTIAVSDSLSVDVYTLAASVYYAEYPNGDDGVAVFQSRPWQGTILTTDGTRRVRGVWRFYTARDPNWDTLVRTTRTDQTTVESAAIPVYVHTYPSRIGPRTEPVRDGPTLIDTWGAPRPSPATRLGENISIDVVTQPYTPTYGTAIRATDVDRDALQITGIVRGVTASLDQQPRSAERQLRASDLSMEVTSQSHSQATLTLELRERHTEAPIALTGDRRDPIGNDSHAGYITVVDQRVRTNASGIAQVTVAEPGIYTATYHPGPWLSHTPAYVSDSATARWHPLGTLDGWVALVFNVGWQLLPFAVMFYAGTRLLRLLSPPDSFH